MHPNKQYIIRIAVICFLLLFGDKLAQSLRVPVDIQLELIPKILSYDKNNNSHDETRIGIMFNSLLRNSKIAKDIIFEEGVAKKSDSDVFLHLIPIDLNNIENLKHIIQEEDIDVLFILPIRGYNIEEISNVCKSYGVVSFCSMPELIQEGISVSFELTNNKLIIVINHKSSIDEGADFSSQLLKISKVVNRFIQ